MLLEMEIVFGLVYEIVLFGDVVGFCNYFVELLVRDVNVVS